MSERLYTCSLHSPQNRERSSPRIASHDAEQSEWISITSSERFFRIMQSWTRDDSKSSGCKNATYDRFSIFTLGSFLHFVHRMSQPDGRSKRRNEWPNERLREMARCRVWVRFGLPKSAANTFFAVSLRREKPHPPYTARAARSVHVSRNTGQDF